MLITFLSLFFFFQNMMAHIRYATVGEVTMENVHPFVRELHGMNISFCHNGECPRFAQAPLPKLGRTTSHFYQPVGDTDSEAVFCSLLNALRTEYPTQLPPLPELYETLERLCYEIVATEHNYQPSSSSSEHENITKNHNSQNQPQQASSSMPTIFNFLLGLGPTTLLAYSWPGSRPGSKVWNGLHYIVREPPFTTAQLIDDEDENGFIDFSTVTTLDDRVVVVTTKPLTNEAGWKEVPKGSLVLFERGHVYWTKQDILTAYRDGFSVPDNHELDRRRGGDGVLDDSSDSIMAISDGEEDDSSLMEQQRPHAVSMG